MRTVATLLLVALLAALGAGCGGDDDGSSTTAAEETQAQPAATADEAAGAVECETVEAPAPRTNDVRKAPTAPLPEGQAHEVVVTTNCGEFTIRLDPKASPRATASFAALVEAGYFDGTTFHRIVPGFVIQGGDPTATGSGGPGYSTVDPPAQDTRYTSGVVAMAKTGVEAPGTSGSQFFIVTAEDAGLPPDYAVIGEVTDGLDVVARIGELGGPDELPTQPVVVEQMTLQSA